MKPGAWFLISDPTVFQVKAQQLLLSLFYSRFLKFCTETHCPGASMTINFASKFVQEHLPPDLSLKTSLKTSVCFYCFAGERE